MSSIDHQMFLASQESSASKEISSNDAPVRSPFLIGRCGPNPSIMDMLQEKYFTFLKVPARCVFCSKKPRRVILNPQKCTVDRFIDRWIDGQIDLSLLKKASWGKNRWPDNFPLQFWPHTSAPFVSSGCCAHQWLNFRRTTWGFG